MTSSAHSPMVFSARSTFAPIALFAIALLLCLGIGNPAQAQYQDQLGVFWDTAYYQDELTTDTFPAIETGYLVLKNPSASTGILGWEACVTVDGPAQFISWDLEGQAINAGTAPCFVVGLSPDPLPPSGNVLLATFQIMVTEALPVIISLEPPNRPSLPGEMSYIPNEDPGALWPMYSINGQPEVAWINRYIPNLQVDKETLHFDNTVIGLTAVNSVTVTNFGLVAGFLDVSLSGQCDRYYLPGISGPVTVLAGESVTIDVGFSPLTHDYIQCGLILGGGLPDVAMIGSGRDLNISWEAPNLVDFGTVGIGDSKTMIVSIRNTGEADIPIDPVIPASCPDFTISSGGYSGTIAPGSTRRVYVIFRPRIIGPQACELDLGSVITPIPLTGSGNDAGLDWNISPTSLDFGSVGLFTGTNLAVIISNTGSQSFQVTPSLVDPCPGFTLPMGAGPFWVYAGATLSIPVRFSPEVLGNHSCLLDLGLPPSDRIPISGIGREPIIDWTAPTSYDFGQVDVGTVENYPINISNTGDIPIEITASLPPATANFQLSANTDLVLQPGQAVHVTVNYLPQSVGPHSVALDLGPIVPPVQISGEGMPRPEGWLISPLSVDFGWLVVGTYLQKSVLMINTGGTFLDLDVRLEDRDQGFSIAGGEGILQLGPGHTHQVDVLFQPNDTGNFGTALDFGVGFTPVPLTGNAETTDNICVVQPDTLFFGSVSLGNSNSRAFSVTNTGHQDLFISPSTSSPGFIFSGSDRTLGAGQTGYFSVIFQPMTPGTVTGSLDLGEQFCSPLPLIGTGESGSGAGQNQVGIFFDPGFTNIEAQTFGPNQIVTGYLVMIEPSETSGVGAWELAADIDGEGIWVGWDLEGQHINVGTYNEFIVGIGGSPLPYAQEVLLATFQILIAEPYPNIVYLELGPIRNPSLPGQMVWAPWHDASMLMPLLPFTGERVVAGINWGAVGVGMPAPLASVTGGSIDLQWPVPGNPGDGCHVYRRDGTGSATRLTDQPLAGYGSTLNYTDTPTGFGPGSVLYYSYAVVDNGVEGDRSPETKVKLAGVPAVATRLLPNVPNPFNPLTAIRFELDRPQHARVAIYDVTGHLIRTLADGHLATGDHERIWQGRDNSGRQVPSGAYYVRLVTGRRVDHQKIMLLK